jgi:hypothetical protein
MEKRLRSNNDGTEKVTTFIRNGAARNQPHTLGPGSKVAHNMADIPLAAKTLQTEAPLALSIH